MTPDINFGKGKVVSTGQALQRAFRAHSTGLRTEVPLFRALITAFASLGSNALAKEYHGTRHQVIFDQVRGAGRAKPQCELCDLLLIHYPIGNPAKARLTWNQAKVTKKHLLPLLTSVGPDKGSFAANLEQWDLLANRPEVTGAYSTFSPPSGLLSAALLPSVGTFGVFYPNGIGYDFAYLVADILQPVNNHVRSSGTLYQSHPISQIRVKDAYKEITGTGSLEAFGNALDASLVGTPITQLMGNKDLPNFRSWFSKLLEGLRRDQPESSLPSELIEGLNMQASTVADASGDEDSVGVKAVVLIRTNPVDEKNVG